ncbi:MAG: hypothetical protein P4M08_09425 [Oligoflexia bacterium]|nr:hypothetical protein [Oligoflexia bacterium]
MRIIICFAILLAATPLWASETANESRFHLLSLKCEPDNDAGPESTPQSPPLNVDDPSTPGCNRFEINVVTDGDIARSRNTWELPLLDLNYGIGDNIQLKYEVPFVNSASQDANASAIGESRAGIKYMFFENEPSKLQLATYPQLTFVSANSDAVIKGLASPGSIVTLPMLLSRRIGATALGEINLTANVGYNISTKADTPDFISAAIGIGTPIRHNMALMGELTTEQAIAKLSDETRSQLVQADLGMMTTITQRFLLFGSVGHSVFSSDTQGHTYILAGFRVLTGGITHESETVASQ